MMVQATTTTTTTTTITTPKEFDLPEPEAPSRAQLFFYQSSSTDCNPGTGESPAWIRRIPEQRPSETLIHTVSGFAVGECVYQTQSEHHRITIRQTKAGANRVFKGVSFKISGFHYAGTDLMQDIEVTQSLTNPRLLRLKF